MLLAKMTRYCWVLNRIRKLSENDFIQKILIPLLSRMDFQSVKAVSHRGQWEFGQDIQLFHKTDDFGRFYYAAQVKVVDIRTKSSRLQGNASNITSQLDTALNTSQSVNTLARNFLSNKFKRDIMIIRQ
jgi:hypothetical protein